MCMTKNTVNTLTPSVSFDTLTELSLYDFRSSIDVDDITLCKKKKKCSMSQAWLSVIDVRMS